MKKIGVCTGSFDPITNGHLDIIERASKLFENVIVLIAENDEKKSTFTLQKRKELVKESIAKFSNVSCEVCNDIVVNYLRKYNDQVVIVRGIRNSDDYSNEIVLNNLNMIINSDIETIYLFAHQDKTSISSTSVKELNNKDVPISKYVPSNVEEALNKNKK